MEALAGKARRAAITLAIATLGALAAPGGASALGLQGLSAQPASTAAGANSNFSISIGFSAAGDQVKDLTIHLPPGLVGNPTVTPLCTIAQLNADACPAASDVGDISNDVTVQVLGFVAVPLTVSGDVYNVTPQAGEPARFGIVLNPLPFDVPVLGPVLFPKITLQSGASLRPGDFGLDTSLKDLPNSTTVAGIATSIDITGVEMTLSGMAGNPPRGFIRNPTSCALAVTRFDATSYAAPATVASGEASFTPTDCAALPFTPELTARLKRVGAANEPHEASTTIAQTIDEAGLLSAQVVLPIGVGANNDALNNKCPRASFAAGTCPPASIVGDAIAASPLLSEQLTGPVALVEPLAPGLPDIGVDLRGPLALKLLGSAGVVAGGRNVVTFAGLPDIPISQFTLTFRGGPGGLIVVSRDICVPPPAIFDATFTSHAGGQTTAAVPGTVEGCGGASATKPRAKVKLGGTGSNEPRLKLKVAAGSESVTQVKLKLPKQLTFAGGAVFKRGIKASADGRRLRGKAVKRSKRGLRLRPQGDGADRVVAKLSGGALRRAGKISRRLNFPVTVKDAAGGTTKLVVRAG